MLREGRTVTTPEGERPLRCGDIAILLRTVANTAPVFRRALLGRGVPVAAARGGEYFSSLEVAAVMDLLAVIDNPHQDVPLIAALRTPCFGFTADELSAIRAEDKNIDFYDALCLHAQSDAKCRAFLGRLGALRAAAPDLGCAELVWQIINEFDLLAIAAAMDEGERRRSTACPDWRGNGPGRSATSRTGSWRRGRARQAPPPRRTPLSWRASPRGRRA